MNNVGECYLHGIGFKRSGLAAVQWHRSAAVAGNPVAAMNLIQDLKNGLGGKADAAAAETWANRRLDQTNRADLDDGTLAYTLRAGVQISSEEREMMRSAGATIASVRAAVEESGGDGGGIDCGFLAECAAMQGSSRKRHPRGRGDPARHPVKIVLLAGPTASGKSRVALDLARRHGGIVVNADSMQVYAELRVLTARPSLADEAALPHRLYGHVPAGERYSVGRWLDDVAAVLGEARRQSLTPIVVGGTGLYFKALTEGLATMPPIPAEVRMRVLEESASESPGGAPSAPRRGRSRRCRAHPADGSGAYRASPRGLRGDRPRACRLDASARRSRSSIRPRPNGSCSTSTANFSMSGSRRGLRR